MGLSTVLAHQLAYPTGAAGWVVGKLMKVANSQPTQWAIDALDVQPGNHVLDLGCGAGQAIALMSPMCGDGQVHGLDQSRVMVAEARRTNRNNVKRGKALISQGAFDHLPYQDNSFDRILASNVMYFWHDPEAVLREVHRVLRPSGKISIYITTAETMSSWKIVEAGAHRLFTLDEVNSLLANSGFALSRIQIDRVSLTGGVSGLIATASK